MIPKTIYFFYPDNEDPKIQENQRIIWINGYCLSLLNCLRILFKLVLKKEIKVKDDVLARKYELLVHLLLTSQIPSYLFDF